LVIKTGGAPSELRLFFIGLPLMHIRKFKGEFEFEFAAKPQILKIRVFNNFLEQADDPAISGAITRAGRKLPTRIFLISSRLLMPSQQQVHRPGGRSVLHHGLVASAFNWAARSGIEESTPGRLATAGNPCS